MKISEGYQVTSRILLSGNCTARWHKKSYLPLHKEMMHVGEFSMSSGVLRRGFAPQMRTFLQIAKEPKHRKTQESNHMKSNKNKKVNLSIKFGLNFRKYMISIASILVSILSTFWFPSVP
ncbi:hypothetical protein L211DRAFT_681102 [Terfezia boudieri ATCC MYA-4762]|uniref:Uncharacterized protein n=1 Tax=Terfezia boudieri ATCC MYA-4762 TaxID=1051890 RepID=A0A3N4LXT6_9PEZI|nr:hypothetical protein L211DRAFT_681102 [Terfezia boudieri ATCC MYA-4762]